MRKQRRMDVEGRYAKLRYDGGLVHAAHTTASRADGRLSGFFTLCNRTIDDLVRWTEEERTHPVECGACLSALDRLAHPDQAPPPDETTPAITATAVPAKVYRVSFATVVCPRCATPFRTQQGSTIMAREDFEHLMMTEPVCAQC